MSEGEVRDEQHPEQLGPTSDTGKALAALFAEDETEAKQVAEAEPTTPTASQETNEPVEQPTDSDDQTAGEETDDGQQTAEIKAPTEDVFEIGGEKLTRAQVEELVGKGKNADSFLKSATQKAQEAAAKERELAAQQERFRELEERELKRELEKLPLPPSQPAPPLAPDVDDFGTTEEYQAARKEYKAEFERYRQSLADHPRLLAEWQEQRAAKEAEIKDKLAQARSLPSARAKIEQEQLDSWVTSESQKNGLTQDELNEAWATASAMKAERQAQGFNPHILDLLAPEVAKVYAKRGGKIAATETAALAAQKKTQEKQALRAPAGKPASSVAPVPKPKNIDEASDDDLRKMLKQPDGWLKTLKELSKGLGTGS